MNEVNNTQEMPNVKDPLNSITIENANLNSEEYFKKALEEAENNILTQESEAKQIYEELQKSKRSYTNTNNLGWYNPVKWIKGLLGWTAPNDWYAEENAQNKLTDAWELASEKRKAAYSARDELRAKYNEYIINKKAAFEKYDLEKKAMSKLGVTNPHTILNFMKGIAPGTALSGPSANYSQIGNFWKKQKDEELDLFKILALVKMMKDLLPKPGDIT